jgi:hypothetical protein
LRSNTFASLLDIGIDGYHNSDHGIFGVHVRTDERVRGDVPDFAIRTGNQARRGMNSPNWSPQFLLNSVHPASPLLCFVGDPVTVGHNNHIRGAQHWRWTSEDCVVATADAPMIRQEHVANLQRPSFIAAY